MILRLLNLVVIAALVLAAAWVYRIKFDATVQAEHLAKLRNEVRAENDKIATLRAEWGELDNPARIQALAKQFLQLKPIAATQFDSLDHLPDRPPQEIATSSDPIGSLIQNFEEPRSVGATGSIPAATAPAAAGVSQAPATAGAPRP